VAAKLALAEQAEAQRDEMLRGARSRCAEHAARVGEPEGAPRPLRTRNPAPRRPTCTQPCLAPYRGARSTLGEVLAARRSEIDARLQALQLEAEQARIWAQLNFLIPHSLNQRPESAQMKARTIVVALIVAGLTRAAGYALYRAGMQRGMQMAAPAFVRTCAAGERPQKAGDIDPGYRQESPLLARSHDAWPAIRQAGQVAVHGHAARPGLRGRGGPRGCRNHQSARPAEPGHTYRRGSVASRSTPAMEAVGSVAYNERDVAVVQARVDGYVEKAPRAVRLSTRCARARRSQNSMRPTGSPPRKSIYRSAHDGRWPRGLLDAARQRMRLCRHERRADSPGRIYGEGPAPPGRDGSASGRDFRVATHAKA
jgi:hypothetical protein